MTDPLDQAALDYRRFPVPGKISVLPTKGLTNRHDLALAYSPGVAAAPHLEVEGKMHGDASPVETHPRPRAAQRRRCRPKPISRSCRTSTPPKSPSTA